MKIYTSGQDHAHKNFYLFLECHKNHMSLNTQLECQNKKYFQNSNPSHPGV